MRTGRILAGILISVAAIAAFPLKSEAKLSSKDLYKQFQNPDSRYRPFVRWWWNGDRVEAEELVRASHHEGGRDRRSRDQSDLFPRR